jgi:glycosyltransferase involved in cell wall biosynthesis
MNFVDMSNPGIIIPPETRIVFVSDLFDREYFGGAEATLAAIMSSCPYVYYELHARDLTEDSVKNNVNKIFVFGNFSTINPQLLPVISRYLKYVVCEFDFKFCKYRLPQLHVEKEGKCDCAIQDIGKLISNFYSNAKHLWFMSQKQMQVYLNNFPQLSRNSDVLSSVFDQKTLDKIKLLRANEKSDTWIVLGSQSWVKGFENAKQYCNEHDLKYEVVWNLPYDDLLEKLSKSKGLVYLPKGNDTCPRLVIEEKLLGCELILNDFVQHKDEQWFNESLERIEAYLQNSHQLFWDNVREIETNKIKISGYCTTYNCISQQYPFEECIRSMLQFCDEVCVVDGGSTDGTLEKLRQIQNDFADIEVGYDPIIISVIERDWNSKQSALFDGMQKAEARDMCTGDYCWQMDVDEVVSEEDAKKVRQLCKFMKNNGIDGICLPVVEFWGPIKNKKIRVDTNPEKWRLSRNVECHTVTHGVPLELRAADAEGNLYCIGGSDGCDMVFRDTGLRVPFVSAVPNEARLAQAEALQGSKSALDAYEQWFNVYTNSLPGVFHYSWIDIERKIRLYRDFWTKHWLRLNSRDDSDTAENNMFFDVPWSQVTNEMIKQRATELQEIGGWVFHRKWDRTKTPWITCNKQIPKI